VTNQTISSLPNAATLSGSERLVLDQDVSAGVIATFNCSINQLIALTPAGTPGPPGPSGPAGPAGPAGTPGGSNVSTDSGNIATLGTDGFIYVPTITYGSLPPEVQEFPISFPITGKPGTAATFFVTAAMAMTIQSNLYGTVGYANTAATANASFTLNKISGGSSVTFGIITAPAGSTGGFTLGGAGGSLAAGDVLQLIAPSPQDATLADVCITVMAQRV